MSKIEKNQGLKINSFFNTIKSLAGLIFPLITFPYVSRILSPEGIGKVNFADSVVVYCAMIANLGISSFAQREAAKIRDDKEKLSYFSKKILLFNIITTILAYIVFFVLYYFVPKFSTYRSVLLILSINIICQTLGVRWLYVALEEYQFVAIRSIIFQFISLILLFSFVHSPEDLLIYVGISAFSSVGSDLWNFVRSCRWVDWRKKTDYNFKPFIKPVLTLFGMNAALSIYYTLDVTLLGFLTTDSEVGYYTAANKMVRLVYSIIVSAFEVLLPRLSYLAEKEQWNKFKEYFSDGILLIIFFSIPCSVGLSCLAEPILLTFSGGAYYPAIKVLKIMTPIIVIISLANIVNNQLFLPLRKEKYSIISVCSGAIINLILNFILIPKYGALGAGIGSILAEFTVMVVAWSLAHQYIDLKSYIIPFVQCVFASFVMGVAVTITVHFIKIYLLKMLLGIIVGVLVYFIILLLFKNTILKKYILNFIFLKRGK